jgi:hypothetical protein
MRLPRVRFTVRRIMAVVAIVAIASGGVVMLKRREAYGIRAAFHARQEQVADGRLRHRSHEAARLAGLPSDASPPVPDHDRLLVAELIDYSRNRVVHHRRLKAKYELAARCPWLSVDPDPPSPDGVTPP